MGYDPYHSLREMQREREMHDIAQQYSSDGGDSGGIGYLLHLYMLPFYPIIVPALLMSFFASIIEALTPVMRFLLIPNIILLVVMTILIPNLRFITSQNRKNDLNQLKLRAAQIYNLLCGFSIMFLFLDPPIMDVITQFADNFYPNPDTIGTSILKVIVLTLLYVVRFLIPLVTLYIVQLIIWLALGKKFIISYIYRKLQK